MNRRGFFITLAVLLFGTTSRPRPQGRYPSNGSAYMPRRHPNDGVVAFSRDPRQFPMRHYVKYNPVPRTTP